MNNFLRGGNLMKYTSIVKNIRIKDTKKIRFLNTILGFHKMTLIIDYIVHSQQSNHNDLSSLCAASPSLCRVQSASLEINNDWQTSELDKKIYLCKIWIFMEVSMATIDIDKILNSEKPYDYPFIHQGNDQTPITSFSEVKFSFKAQSTQHLPGLNNMCSLLGKISHNFQN